MKKFILPIALAAVMSVSAQVPNTFNYQGVCAEKSSSIEVTFQVVNDQDNALYKEVQTVETNENGVFTAVVGEGDAITTDGWDSIDWTQEGLKLVTLINGVNVSEATFKAVPYANVAGSVAGLTAQTLEFLTTDFEDLVMANRKNTTDLAELRASFDNVLENLDMMTPVLNQMLDDIEANTTAIEANKAAADADLAELRTQVEELEAAQDEYDRQLQETLAETFGEVEDRLEALESVTNDIAGLYDQLRGKASVEDVADLRTQVEELEAAQDEYDRQLQETLQETFTEVEDRLEALESVTDDIAGLYDQLRGKASVEHVDEIEDQLLEVQNMAANFIGSFDETYMAPIQDALDGLQALVVEKDEATQQYLTMVINRVEDNTAAIEANKAAADADLAELRAMIEDHASFISSLLRRVSALEDK